MNRKQRRAEAKGDKSQSHAALDNEMFAAAYHHHQAGRLAEAEALYRRILARVPRHADSLHLLGVIAGQTGRLDMAVQAISQAIAVNGREGEYHANLGNALFAQGRIGEAVACFSRAASLAPDHPETWNSLGVALKDLDRHDDAIKAFKSAIGRRADFAEAHNNLGIALNAKGLTGKAIGAYRQAIAFHPGFAQAYNNLGNNLRDQGRLVEAKAMYERALALRPDYLNARSNLLMLLQCLAQYGNADLLAGAETFARCVERPSGRPPAGTRGPAPERLRVGFVSADFRTHSVAYFLTSLFESRQAGGMEIFCYSNWPLSDGMTRRLAGAADHWRDIVGMGDEDAARLVIADGIDVLIDLSGHTAGNRLGLFARKPAPVQATWLGYSGTTGLASIDYVLADRHVVPEGDEAAFSETVLRLPDSYLCYTPHRLDCPVGPFPALDKGYVTFGSFNNWAKTSDETIAAWTSILAAVRGSRLFLKSKSFADPDCLGMTKARFADRGIAADRLSLKAHLPQADALAAYNDIDIALDPFPYGGTTTTCETLWMGVPVVTLRGDRWVARVGASILETLGLPQWIAADTDAYVGLARDMAENLGALIEIRAGLRARLEQSPLCDAPRFARAFEVALREMYERR